MIIKNGLVIDPASGLSEKMDLLIEDGIIKEMASLITLTQPGLWLHRD